MESERQMDGQAIDILKACRGQASYVRSLQEAKEETLAQLGNIRAMNYEEPRVSSSTISDVGTKVEKAWERLRELNERIAVATEKMASLKVEALDLIEYCGSATHKAALIDYYINGYDWNEVAVRQHYGERSIYRIRDEAILAIEANRKLGIKWQSDM